MRFFSNEAKDNTDEQDTDTRAEQQDDRAEHKQPEPAQPEPAQPEHAQSEPVAVPQQRAGSPWQHGPADTADRPVVDPAPQPTAFGASTVSGAVAASAAAGPYETDTRSTDRVTDAASGVADDRTGPLGDRTADKGRTEVSETDRQHTAEDEVARAGSEPDHDTRLDADRDDSHPDPRRDDDPVDLALEDRGTFDDPRLDQEMRTGDREAVGTVHDDVATGDKPADDKEPEVVAVAVAEKPAPAEKPAVSGPAPFFPSADTDAFRERWRDVQLRFVDDPKGATAEAAGLVDEAVDKLTAALRDHRGSLAKGSEETEALRVELRSYRDILDRLLGL